MTLKVNSSVLVTGADGFIGSHLAEMLAARGCRVRALSQYNSFNNWGWLESLPCRDDIEVVCGDIRDPFFCRTLTEGIDVVFHLAALIAIPFSYVAPASYVDTHIAGAVPGRSTRQHRRFTARRSRFRLTRNIPCSRSRRTARAKSVRIILP